MNTAMWTDSLKMLAVLSALGSSAAFAVSSQPSMSVEEIAPVAAVANADKSLPTSGTTLDSDGKILAFSMPVLIDVVNVGTGDVIKVRAVRRQSGKGMSMEVVDPVPSTATGTYSGLLPVSLDYN